MNISEVGKKIRKWDEVTGNAVEIQISETVDPAEDVGDDRGSRRQAGRIQNDAGNSHNDR